MGWGNCGIAGWKDTEGSKGWERSPDFFAAAGDIQAKPTRVSGGLDFLVIIEGKTAGKKIK